MQCGEPDGRFGIHHAELLFGEFFIRSEIIHSGLLGALLAKSSTVCRIKSLQSELIKRWTGSAF